MTNIIYDVRRLRRWLGQVAAIADVSTPEASVIVPHAAPADAHMGKIAAGNVAVVAGSFNPATLAHLSLCEAALQQPDIGSVWYSLAVHTIDKEQITGACLVDRLCMLEMLAASRPNVGVVLCNRGLYVDQAEALRGSLAGPGQELVFVVGFDKIQQILDPRYYTDRQSSLDRLFALSRFLVAERDAHGAQELAALLAQPANRAYRNRIEELTTLPAYHDPALSSTGVRAAYTEGQESPAGAATVPEAVQAFIASTGVYGAPMALQTGETVDRYGVRKRILAALAAEPEGDFTAHDFQAAVALAATDTKSGLGLRRLLNKQAGNLRDIREFLARRETHGTSQF